MFYNEMSMHLQYPEFTYKTVLNLYKTVNNRFNVRTVSCSGLGKSFFLYTKFQRISSLTKYRITSNDSLFLNLRGGNLTNDWPPEQDGT